MNVLVWVAVGLFGKWLVEKTLASNKPSQTPAEASSATPRRDLRA